MNIKRQKAKPKIMQKTFYHPQVLVQLPSIETNQTGGSFNQTIIINNPKININYLQNNQQTPSGQYQPELNNKELLADIKNQTKKQQATLYNVQAVTKEIKGIELWNLNQNLKEFSETRKKGFMKTQEKSIVSPYAIQKNKTQQIRPVNKIYANNTIHGIERSRSKNSNITAPLKLEERSRTISTIKKDTLTPLNNFYDTLSSKTKFRNRVVNYSQKTPRQIVSQKKLETFDPYLRTFINGGHLKRQNSQDLQDCSNTQQNAIHKNRKAQSHMQGHLRKNKFQTISNLKSQQEANVHSPNLSQQIECKHIDRDNEQMNQIDEEFRSTSSPSGTYDLLAKGEEKRRNYGYTKSIQKINKSLLKKVDQYLDSFNYSSIPSSKIQFYINSLNQPEYIGHNEYKSTAKDIVRQGYNFQFVVDDEKKKNRSITPFKRKKIYQVA